MQLLLESYTHKLFREFLINESDQYKDSIVNRKLVKAYDDRPYNVYDETTDMAWMMGGSMKNDPSRYNTMQVARSDKDMGYIGEPKRAYQLWNKFGIEPECIDDSHGVCSIGWSEKDQKYYGWSHRALCGFSIGDKIYDQKYSDPRGDKTPFIEHGDKEIKNKADARKAAINFANSVA